MIIQSVQRALDILSLFSYSRPRWGITEISLALALPKGTIHNIVKTLDQAGFLQRDEETRKYALGPRVFSLGTIMGGTLEINRKALGPAHRLAEETGLVCRVAIWDRDAALVTLDIDPRESEPFSARIGPRVLAYCSAIGRALLAHFTPEDLQSYMERTDFVAFTPHTIATPADLLAELEKTRVRGYAVNNQEIALGRASLGAPVFGPGGRLSASISLTGSAQTLLGQRLKKHAEALCRAAAEISSLSGYFPASAEAPGQHRSGATRKRG